MQASRAVATELLVADWDLDDALWVLAHVCKAELAQHRHGNTVEVSRGMSEKLGLAEQSTRVLASVAPGGVDHTTLELSDSAVRHVYADYQNLEGSTSILLPLELPPDGKNLWL